MKKYLQFLEELKNLLFNKLRKDSSKKTSKKKEKKQEKKEMGWFETLVYAAILAIIFRSFLYEPFHIPSGSMKPNLLIGDYVFVSKLSYGYSKYSFPFGDKFNYFEGRIFEDEPKRGDIIVFRLPSDDSINYIKRVIGLPGDKIQVRSGILYINDQKIAKEFDGFFFEDNNKDEPYEIMQYSEKLADDKKILVLDQVAGAMQDDTKVYEVPEDHYFFMGDNRDNSRDSRFGDVGFIPKQNLVGKAKIIFFSNPSPIWQPIDWLISIRFSRIFKITD